LFYYCLSLLLFLIMYLMADKSVSVPCRSHPTVDDAISSFSISLDCGVAVGVGNPNARDWQRIPVPHQKPKDAFFQVLLSFGRERRARNATCKIDIQHGLQVSGTDSIQGHFLRHGCRGWDAHAPNPPIPTFRGGLPVLLGGWWDIRDAPYTVTVVIVMIQ
jgi:hypothetical protein